MKAVIFVCGAVIIGLYVWSRVGRGPRGPVLIPVGR